MADDLTQLPTIHRSVVHMLANADERNRDGEALVCGDERLTYRELVRCVGGFAYELKTLGVAGDRVALVCGNSLDMAIAMFAVHAARMQEVPINPLYTERELEHILSDSNPVAVVCDGEAEPRVTAVAQKLWIQNVLVVGNAAGRSLTSWRDDAEANLPQPFPDSDSLATLQYTGGTTGLPKGVNITHRQLSVNISQREAFWPTRPNSEVVLCVMPLFHVFASSMCLHLAVYCSSSLIIQPRYHPEAVLDAIEHKGVTLLPLGPTIFHGLLALKRIADVDFSTLRTAYSGSAPLPQKTLSRWEALTGCQILEGYGQTEAGPVLTVNKDNTPIIVASVGVPLPGTQIQIVDVETGKHVLDVGNEGEICARGPQIMTGYRDRPKETAQTLRDGWLYTGDIGRLDADGVLYITDRKKDMALVGGFNVYPREIDEVLYAHPNVVEAAAVGVPDAYRGEVIHVFVVLKAQPPQAIDDLRYLCDKQLARYKQPHTYHVVADIPKTTVGKVDKAAIRRLIADTDVTKIEGTI